MMTLQVPTTGQQMQAPLTARLRQRTGVLGRHRASVRRQLLVRSVVVKERAAATVTRPQGPLKPDATLDLPVLTGAHLKDTAVKELSSVITQSPPRAAKADIYYPKDFATTKKALGAIIFAHAFVQPSYSYNSVITQLQEAGWVVVAPTTDVFDVIGRDVGVKFDQKRADVKLQSTLQSALIVDVLRAHQMVLEDDTLKGVVKDIVFMGHSLGGACSIIAAAKVQNLKGVAVMSPEVREMQKTPVNDDIWLLNGDEKSVEAAMNFFRDEFGNKPLVLISSRRDNIALPDDLRRLFVVSTLKTEGENVALFSIDGNHFGYENELDLPNRVNFDGAALKLGPINISLAPLDKPLSGLINLVNKRIVPAFEFLQYTYNPVFHLLLGNSNNQEPQNLTVLKNSLAAISAGQSLASVAVGDGVAVETQPTPEEIKRVTETEPQGNTKPVLWVNALLSTYAGVQLLTAATAFGQLQLGYGDFETKFGLFVLGSLSASLVYENALLVTGRLFGKSEEGLQLLQELSKWRFLAHSGAPLALVAGLNMAGRAGVEWAANPYYEGLIGLLILAVVAVSSVRNSLFLEITPVWSKGILRYSYAQGSTDFTRVIPVIVTTVVLMVLGWQSFKQDAALLPFFVGPLAAFILNALPAGKDGEVNAKLPPQFVLGNGGEVLLFGSLVFTEVLLHLQGK